jgi:hypothetical protein
MKFLITLLLSFVTVAHAEDGGLLPGLISAPMLLPVSIAGNDMTLDSYVVRPDRPGRFPLVIMLHGTPSEGDAFVSELAKRTPINFNTAAVALAQRGMRPWPSCVVASACPAGVIPSDFRRPVTTFRPYVFQPKMSLRRSQRFEASLGLTLTTSCCSATQPADSPHSP